MKSKVWERESYRVQKVQSEMRNVISDYIQFKSHHPKLGSHVSIVQVGLTKDLKNVKVFYSLMSLNGFDAQSEENVKEIGNILKEIRPLMSGSVARELNLRYAPKIQFVHQTSFDPSIEDLFTQIKFKSK